MQISPLLRLCVAAALTTITCLVCAQNEPESSAASSAQSSEKPIYGSVGERDNELMAKAFGAIAKADEIQWLETPNEKIVSLLKPGEEPKVKGVLLILHAPEVPQLWPAPLENLRRNLPVYGWTTMAVPLPAKYPQLIPKRDLPATNVNSSTSTASEAASEAASSSESSSEDLPKASLPRSQLIAERVEAAKAQLNKTGQLNLVVLVDNSSAPDALASLYSTINKGNSAGDTIDGPLQALILVNLQTQEPMSNEQLAAAFSVANLPVLDVFFNTDSLELVELRRSHRAQAMRQNLKDYQQLTLPPEQLVTVDDKQSFWLGKVHGFLERKAQGSELAKKTAK